MLSDVQTGGGRGLLPGASTVLETPLLLHQTSRTVGLFGSGLIKGHHCVYEKGDYVK